MNLREELEKKDLKLEKEEEKEREIRRLQNVFLEYLKGNKVDKKDEELILDELQRCVDQHDYSDSIFKLSLVRCFLQSDYKRWLSIQIKAGHITEQENIYGQKVLDELKEVRSFPKSIKLLFYEILDYKREIDFLPNFNSYNEILLKNNLPALDENYSIKDLEMSIINLINQKKPKFFYENQDIGEIFDSKKFAKGIDFDILFYKKDKDYCLFKDGYLINSWEKILYARYLINTSDNGIVFSKEVGDINGHYIKEGYNIKFLEMKGKTFYDNYKILYDENSDIDTCLKKFKKDKKYLCDISRKKLEKFTCSLIEKISNFKSENYKEAQDLIDEECKNNSIKAFILKLRPYSIIIIDDGFFALIHVYLKPDKVFYGYFTDTDYFSLDIETTKESVDLSPLMYNPKTGGDASVVGRTIVGHLLGGTVGGLIGAMSAIEKNNRIEATRQRLAQTPLIHNYTKKEFILFMYLKCTLGSEDPKNAVNGIMLTTYNQEIVDKLLATLSIATSAETLTLTKYIKKYFEEKGDIEYDEKLINDFVKSEIEKDRKKFIDNYWKTHSKEKKELDDKLNKLKQEETDLKNELSKLEKDNKKTIDKIKEKYNINYEEEKEIKIINKEISHLKEQLSTLGLFAFSKKSEIKNNISSLEDKLEELNKKLSIKRNNSDKEMKKEIKLLDKDKNEIEELLNNNLLEQDKINSKLNLED